MAVEVLFWVSILLIVYAYAGYPLLVWAVGSWSPRTVHKADHLPRVTVLIAAFNEEACIAGTILNKLNQDYTPELLDVLVVSDGSTDRTELIVRELANPRLRLIVQEPRSGKTTALNRMAPEAAGEILVFSDANSIYEEKAIREIARNFHDPSVGYVTGKMVYVDEKGSLIGSGCSAYMRYENLLRGLETRVGSVVGVDGGVDAVRKELYEPMRPDLGADIILPLKAVQKGFRVVYEPGALLWETSLSKARDEFRMRTRVILHTYHGFWVMSQMFNPFRHGFYSIQLLSHKVLRYGVGILQIGLLISNALLLPGGTFYVACFAAQTAFYVCALAGLVMERLHLKQGFLYYPYYLCLLNTASLFALVKFFFGVKQVTWTPRVG